MSNNTQSTVPAVFTIDPHAYKAIEIAVALKNQGAYVCAEEAAFGTTSAAINSRTRTQTEMSRICAANLLPWLREQTVIVHIPDVEQSGERLSEDARRNAFDLACGLYGVAIPTQSGGKGGTFNFITEAAFNRLSGLFLTAEEVTAYAGLFFSSTTGQAIKVAPQHIGVEDLPGADGNSLGTALPGEKYGRGAQGRFIGLDCGYATRDEDGNITALGKGTRRVVGPTAGLPHVQVARSQVKVGKNANSVAGIWLINADVNGRTALQYCSFELLQLLDRNSDEVKAKVYKEVDARVTEVLELLSPEQRATLLERMGELRIEDGKVLPARRAIMSLLQSSVPWSDEVEKRVGRWAIEEITHHIIPSGGMAGRRYLLHQDDHFGASPCSWEEARCFAFRMPVLWESQVVPFAKNPKGVITSEAAGLMDGDSDGDYLIVVDDPEWVALFRDHRLQVAGEVGKPEKVRSETPVTIENVNRLAWRLTQVAPYMGRLTLAAAKALQAEKYELALEFARLANWSPMLAKWDVKVDGVAFEKYANRLLSEYADWLKETKMHWRDAMHASDQWKTLRDLTTVSVPRNGTLMDFAWNTAVRAACVFYDAHPIAKISLLKMRAKIAERHGDLSGAAQRKARAIHIMWSEYWAAHRAEDGEIDDENHKSIYDSMRSLGEHAEVEVLAALATRETTIINEIGDRETRPISFGLLYAVMGTRWPEVYGYNPQVVLNLQDRGLMLDQAPLVEVE